MKKYEQCEFQSELFSVEDETDFYIALLTLLRV